MNNQTAGQVRPEINLNSNQAAIPEEPDYNIRYYFVAIDRQMDGYELINSPISPNFRNPDEAVAYLDQCGIEGAKAIGGVIFINPEREGAETERAEMDHRLFVEQNEHWYKNSAHKKADD